MQIMNIIKNRVCVHENLKDFKGSFSKMLCFHVKKKADYHYQFFLIVLYSGLTYFGGISLLLLVSQAACVTAGAVMATCCLSWTRCWWGRAGGGEALAFTCWRISAPRSPPRRFWDSALHYHPAWWQVSWSFSIIFPYPTSTRPIYLFMSILILFLPFSQFPNFPTIHTEPPGRNERESWGEQRLIFIL